MIAKPITLLIAFAIVFMEAKQLFCTFGFMQKSRAGLKNDSHSYKK